MITQGLIKVIHRGMNIPFCFIIQRLQNSKTVPGVHSTRLLDDEAVLDQLADVLPGVCVRDLLSWGFWDLEGEGVMSRHHLKSSSVMINYVLVECVNS